MLSKRIIATLIASSFAAAQAGAHSYLSEASESEAQPSEMTLSEDPFPRQLTVFNPDGTSYSLVADAYTVSLEPTLLVIGEEPLPDQLTVFDPDGTVTSYQFTPVDVAYVEPQYDIAIIDVGETLEPLALNGETQVILVEVAEPMIVALADDEGSFDPVVWFDDEGAPWSIPDHVAAFDEALERTG